MSSQNTFRPFSNGSERDRWKGANCATCRLGYVPDTAKGRRCRLERALDDAAMGNGEIPMAVADRIGRRHVEVPETPGYDVLGDCRERKAGRRGPQTSRAFAVKFRACFDQDTREALECETEVGRTAHARCTGEGIALDGGLVRCPCACHRETAGPERKA